MTDRKQWQTGASTCIIGEVKETWGNIFRQYNEAGIKYAELCQSASELSDNDFAGNLERIADIAEKNAVKLWSYHVPFRNFPDISTLDARKGDKGLALIEKRIHAALETGIKTIVIHPSSEYYDDTYEKRLNKSIENLRYLAHICSEENARLAIENLPGSCLGNNSFDIITYLNEIPELDLCFDTNHLTMQTNEDFLEDIIYHNMHGRVRTVHISDYDFMDECHNLPGDGINDWNTIMSMLEELDYRGVFMYEIYNRPNRKNITLADIKENHKNLMG